MLTGAILASLAIIAADAGALELPAELAVTDADVFAAMDLERPGLEAVRDAVAANDLPAAGEAWAAYMRAREKPVLYFSRDSWADFIRSEMPQLEPPILEAADRIVNHEIGHGPYTMAVQDGRIDWHYNPTKDTNYVSVVGSQWLLNPLGRAYLLTGDEKYADAFVWFFDSWFDNRESIRQGQGGLGFAPIYHAYYPGIRCRVLIDNYHSLAKSAALTASVQMKLMRELLGSARWLYNRNRGFQVGNQQVGAVLGTAMVGAFFPEFKEAQTWVDLANVRMREHLERDFFPDGGHKELCTQYHKTVLRDVGYVALTQENNGDLSLLAGGGRVPLERAYEWLAAIVMPTGETPPLHSAVFATDWPIHLTVGARLMHRADFWWLAKREWDKGIVPSQKGPVSLATYMISETFSRRNLSDLEPQPPAYESIHLDSSGFAVMRTGRDAADRYAVFQYGWANTGHAYPAALSFLLEMNGEVVATHPGSPLSYRDSAYSYCHSTRSHNVVSINNASYTPAGKFAPGGHLAYLADVPGAWYARGHHDGYDPLFGAVHQREMLVIKDGPVFWLDQISGGKGATARWHFHTPLGVRTDEQKVAHLIGNARYVLLPANPEEIDTVEVEQHWEAVLPRDCQPDDCGKVVPALAWVKQIGEDGTTFAMALVEGDAAGFKAVSDGLFECRTETGRYLVGFGPIEGEIVSTDARCSCVKFAGEQLVEAWAFEATRLSVGGEQLLASDEPTDAHLVP